MSRSQFPVPDKQEVLILQQGLVPTDFEFTYGGRYVALATALIGGGAGTQSLQMQAYAGPEETDPTAAGNSAYWVSAGTALVVGTPTEIYLGSRTRVRLTPTGAATGTGLYVTLKRIPN